MNLHQNLGGFFKLSGTEPNLYTKGQAESIN